VCIEVADGQDEVSLALVVPRPQADAASLGVVTGLQFVIARPLMSFEEPTTCDEQRIGDQSGMAQPLRLVASGE